MTGGVSLAEICVVACAEVWRGDGEVLASPIGIVPTIEALCQQVDAVLLESVDGSSADRPSYETRVVAGPASKALLEAAQRYGADEIVLGAAANRQARGAIGCVSAAVLRHSSSPVTIVPPAPRGATP